MKFNGQVRIYAYMITILDCIIHDHNKQCPLLISNELLMTFQSIFKSSLDIVPRSTEHQNWGHCFSMMLTPLKRKNIKSWTRSVVMYLGNLNQEAKKM